MSIASLVPRALYLSFALYAAFCPLSRCPNFSLVVSLTFLHLQILQAEDLPRTNLRSDQREEIRARANKLQVDGAVVGVQIKWDYV